MYYQGQFGVRTNLRNELFDREKASYSRQDIQEIICYGKCLEFIVWMAHESFASPWVR